MKPHSSGEFYENNSVMGANIVKAIDEYYDVPQCQDDRQLSHGCTLN